MRTKEEINKRIDDIIDERKIHIDCQKNYKWSEKELEEGSQQYGKYQEREEKCNLRIRELQWVLNAL